MRSWRNMVYPWSKWKNNHAWLGAWCGRWSLVLFLAAVGVGGGVGMGVGVNAWAQEKDDVTDPVDDDLPDAALQLSPSPALGRMGDPVQVDPEQHEFSRAETLLWMNDHLANIEGPVRLRYVFHKRGSMEEPFEDTVLLDVRELHEDGSKDVHLQFFPGTREQQTDFNDNLTKVRGNPVLGIYLQGDVYDMNRLTEGHWRYFHRKIKLALADTHETDQREVEWEGRSVSAEVVRIYPYSDDDKHGKDLQEFSGKFYEFIFSEAVPGSLYQIRTVVPSLDGGEPLIEEILSFSGREEF